MSGGVDSSVAAHLLTRAGPRRDRRLHAPWRSSRRRRARSEERGARSETLTPTPRSSLLAPAPSQARLLHRQRRRGCPPRGRQARHSVLRAEPAGTSSARSSTTSSPSTRPAARRTRACSATTGSSSASCSTTPTASAPSLSRPATTRGWNAVPTVDVALLRGVDAAKDQSYVLFGIRPRAVAADDAAGRQLREAGDPSDRGRTWACAWPRRRTARKSASSRAGGTTSSCAAAATRGHGRRAGDDRRHGRRRARRHRGLHRRPAEGPGRRARRAQVRRADRAGVAARGDWRSRRNSIAAS